MRQHNLMVRAADLATSVVRGVRPDQLTLPTPCADWDVRALLDHLSYVAILGNRSATPASIDFCVLAEQLTESWADPGAWEGTMVFGAAELPAPLAAELTMGDLVLHGWDLATATGREFKCDDELAAAVEAGCRSTAELARTMGLFGPELAVPPDASPLDRALAVSGRDPSWSGG